MTDYDVRASAGKVLQVISQVECEELGTVRTKWIY